MMGRFGMKMIWSNLNGPNSFTSSLETMPTKIIHFSKYVSVVPRGDVPGDIVKSPQRGFRGEGLHRAAEVRSHWGRMGTLRRGALPRSRRTSQHGKRVLVEKGNFLWEDMSLGDG
jgi:hypothetical protein